MDETPEAVFVERFLRAPSGGTSGFRFDMRARASSHWQAETSLPPRESDEALIRRVRATGDADAFLALVEKYQDKIYRLALRLMRNRADAEDITQEVFLTAFTKLRSFRAESSFYTWLYRIGLNACYASMRSSRRARTESLEEYLPRFRKDGHHAFIPSDMTYTSRDWSGKVEEQLLHKEIRKLLEQALSLLPLSSRIVYVLRDMEGLSNEEIAALLKVSMKAVKSRLHRARLTIHERLSRYFEATR